MPARFGRVTPDCDSPARRKILLACASFSAVNRFVIRFVVPAVIALAVSNVQVIAQPPELRSGGELAALDAASFEAASSLAYPTSQVWATLDTESLISGLPMLGLLDGRYCGSSALARMAVTRLDVRPLAMLWQSPTVAGRSAHVPESGAADGDYALRSNPVYAGGEVGMFYGTSTGKYGGEQYGGYIIGTIATDKVQVTAGASYQESNFRFPRRGR